MVAAVCIAGCEPPITPHQYSVVSGKVVTCRTDTGELSVRGTRRTADGPVDETIYCLITRDTEIYVNDKFSSISEIKIGDAVELIGHRDPDPQLERFVVSFAYFDHPLPPPPRPELVPASAPAAEAADEHQKTPED
jgi:hypothetical protein